MTIVIIKLSFLVNKKNRKEFQQGKFPKNFVMINYKKRQKIMKIEIINYELRKK